ncbi:MAG: hypothetical protein ACR2LC_09715 [Pyrinomonadaceae bacterium]
MERLNQRPLMPGVNFNSIVAFSLPPSESNFTLKYNADLTALDMSLNWQDLNLFGSYDHPYLALTWAESRRKIGSYVGRNAFNRSVRVDAYRIDKFYLESDRQSLERISSFTKGTLDGSFDTSVVMPPSVARLAKTNTRALIIGHLSSQPISYTHGRSTPTISDPYDRYEFTYALNLIVDEVWFYDYPTGNILVKLSKSPGS